MDGQNAHRTGRLALALCGVVGTLCGVVGTLAGSPPAAAQAEEAPESSILDARGYLTCRAFSRMGTALQSGFLMGLREGWQTSAGALDANASVREDLGPEYQEALRAGAVYLRRLIDHAGASHGLVLRRTQAGCSADPDAVVWKAWFDAIAEGRSPGGG